MIFYKYNADHVCDLESIDYYDNIFDYYDILPMTSMDKTMPTKLLLLNKNINAAKNIKISIFPII